MDQISPALPPLHQRLLDLAEAAGAASSVSPEQVARAAAGDAWRSVLNDVRSAAVSLAQAGRIEILRKGKPISPTAFKGVWRIRIASP